MHDGAVANGNVVAYVYAMVKRHVEYGPVLYVGALANAYGRKVCPNDGVMPHARVLSKHDVSAYDGSGRHECGGIGVSAFHLVSFFSFGAKVYRLIIRPHAA